MKLTKTEKIILKNTDTRYKYIARDKHGDLYLYSGEPIRGLICFWNNDEKDVCHDLDMFNHLFQNIQFKNGEPLRFRDDKGEFVL